MEKEKIITKNTFLNFRFELSSLVSHKQHFIIAFNRSTSFRRPLSSRNKRYKVLSCNALQSPAPWFRDSSVQLHIWVLNLSWLWTNIDVEIPPPRRDPLTSQMPRECRERGWCWYLHKFASHKPIEHRLRESVKLIWGARDVINCRLYNNHVKDT